MKFMFDEALNIQYQVDEHNTTLKCPYRKKKIFLI